MRAAKGADPQAMDGPGGRPSRLGPGGEEGAARPRSAPAAALRVLRQGPFGPTVVSSAGDRDCVEVLDDVDNLLDSLDQKSVDGSRGCADGDASEQAADEIAELVVEPQGYGFDSGVMPYLDRYETTERLLEQLEETLQLMEARGTVLTTAWELVRTARALLESAEIVQALIYANRALRVALEVNRLQMAPGGAAS